MAANRQRWWKRQRRLPRELKRCEAPKGPGRLPGLFRRRRDFRPGDLARSGKLPKESANPRGQVARCSIYTARKSVLAYGQRAGQNRLRAGGMGTRETIVSTNVNRGFNQCLSAQPVFAGSVSTPGFNQCFRAKRSRLCQKPRFEGLKPVSTRFQPNSQPALSGPRNKIS